MADDSLAAELTHLDDRILVGTSGLVGTLDDLLPDERIYVEHSIVSRQIDFATGRVLARRLLRELGQPDQSIRRDHDRVPIWPAGILGSISHTEGACLVALSRDGSFRGIGVDVEVDSPRTNRFLERITTKAERARLLSDAERRSRATCIFGIKEAVYKACFPALRERWGFREVEVEMNWSSGKFRAHVPKTAEGNVEGWQRERDGRVWTVACWVG